MIVNSHRILYKRIYAAVKIGIAIIPTESFDSCLRRQKLYYIDKIKNVLFAGYTRL